MIFYCTLIQSNTVKATSVLIPSCLPALLIITWKFRKILCLTETTITNWKSSGFQILVSLRITWKICPNADWWAPRISYSVVWSGSRICISNKISDHAEAAVWDSMLWEPIGLQGCCRLLTVQSLFSGSVNNAASLK